MVIGDVPLKIGPQYKRPQTARDTADVYADTYIYFLNSCHFSFAPASHNPYHHLAAGGHSNRRKEDIHFEVPFYKSSKLHPDSSKIFYSKLRSEKVLG